MVETIVGVGAVLLVLGISLATTRLAALWLSARRTGWWQVLFALILAWVVTVLATVGAGVGMAFIPPSLELPEPVLIVGLVIAVLLPTLLAFALALGTNLVRAFGIGFLSYVMSTAIVVLMMVVLPIVGLGGALGIDTLLGLAREEMTVAGVRLGPAGDPARVESQEDVSLDELWRSADAVCDCRTRGGDPGAVSACVRSETGRFVALQSELLTGAAARGDTDAIEEIELATQRADPCMDRQATAADAPPREVSLEELQAETRALCECVARHPPGSGPRQDCVSRYTRPFSLPDDPDVVRLANEAMEQARRCMSGIPGTLPEPPEVERAAAPVPAPEPPEVERAAAPVPAPEQPRKPSPPATPKRPAASLAAAYHWREMDPADVGSALYELVWITDSAGSEYKGLLMEVRPGALVIKRAVADGGDMKEIPAGEVRGIKVFEKRG